MENLWDVHNLWTLRSWGNRPSDINLDNVDFVQHLYSGVGGINRLMDAHAFSRTQDPFFYWLPGSPVIPDTGGFNSGSITSGKLHATGLHPGSLPIAAPGWNNPVPSSFFGRP